MRRQEQPAEPSLRLKLPHNVIEVIGADTPASLSLESKMLGAPFAPSTAGQIARLIKISRLLV
jgi:hypothetical protein